MSDACHYSVYVKSPSGVVPNVQLNGFTLAPFRQAGRGGHSRWFQVNSYVKPGQNSLRVAPTGPAPSNTSENVPTGFVAKMAARHVHALRPQQGDEVASYQVDVAESGLLQATHPFVAEPAPPSLLWQEASCLAELDAEHRRDILTIVDAFTEALWTESIETYLDLMQYCREDMARAMSWPAQREWPSLDDLETERHQAPDWDVPEPDFDELELRLIADGQVVAVRRQGGPLFEFPVQSLGQTARYDIYFGLVGNEWKIVRFA